MSISHRLFRHAPIGRRIALGALVSALALAAMLAMAADIHRSALFAERERALGAFVEMAENVVRRRAAEASAGRLGLDAAKKAALADIRVMRHTAFLAAEPAGADYLFVLDKDGRMLAHPVAPELEGRDLSQIHDSDGVRLVERFRAGLAEAPRAVVRYQWPRPRAAGGEGAPASKISVVGGANPWGWIIGTGAYVDDLEAAVGAEMTALLAILAAGAVIIMGALALAAHSIATQLAVLTAQARGLARRACDKPICCVEDRTEFGEIARAIEAIRLEALAAAAAGAERDRAQIALRERTAALDGLCGQIAEAASAAKDGDFSRRLPLDLADPDMSRAADAVNALIAEVDREVSDASAAMARLAKGDLSQRMLGPRRGAFATFQSEHNAALDRYSGLVVISERAVALSGGARSALARETRVLADALDGYTLDHGARIEARALDAAAARPAARRRSGAPRWT